MTTLLKKMDSMYKQGKLCSLIPKLHKAKLAKQHHFLIKTAKIYNNKQKYKYLLYKNQNINILFQEKKKTRISLSETLKRKSFFSPIKMKNMKNKK